MEDGDRSGMNKVIRPEYRIKSEVANRISRISGFPVVDIFRQGIHACSIANIDKINFPLFSPGIYVFKSNGNISIYNVFVCMCVCVCAHINLTALAEKHPAGRGADCVGPPVVSSSSRLEAT